MITAALALAVLLAPPAGSESITDEVRRRSECTAHTDDPRMVDCRFSAGADAVLVLAAVGMPDATFIVERSNFKGDAYVRFAPASGCAMIKRTAVNPAVFFDVAFVSPRTGKVYSDGEDCRRAGDWKSRATKVAP